MKFSGYRRSFLRANREYAIRIIKFFPYGEKYARKLLSIWRKLNRCGPATYKGRGGQIVLPLVLPSEFRVATILDEFSHGSFEGEFQSIPIEPDNWRELFDKHKPQVFFCESAWSGKDSKRRPWKGKIYSSVNFKTENRGALLEVLAYCSANKIPTVFWNKEDPAHYEDKIHNFVETAKLFDFVFTTAEECVESYRQDHGCKNVYALPFATQPRLFNPIEPTNPRSSEVVFAGSWYNVHRERAQLMEHVFDRLLADGQTLKIYDRHFGGTDPNHHFPEKYQQYLNPPIPHENLAQVYKSSRYGLNFNTVTTSDSMFARRVFELMSSNTLVLSNYSVGMEKMFGDCVIFLDREPERLSSLSSADIDRLREKALTLVLGKHTYKHRWEYILSKAGIQYKEEDNTTTIICTVADREEAQAALDFFSMQQAIVPETRLLLYLSDAIPDDEVALYYQTFNRFGVTVTARSFIQRYRSASYHPVDTRNFLIVQPGSFPKKEWLKHALLHLEYANDYLLSCASEANRFRFTRVETDQPLLGRTRAFKSSLNFGNDLNANSVLNV
ncbi:glycosyltransferase [Phyllobacterium sp. CCNWLW109]|uniref:CgeB family protein n=1 Tax=Phyllobacterium sp. CCNWLW109 TaxID=3127479 RepID=UPI00307720A6